MGIKLLVKTIESWQYAESNFCTNANFKESGSLAKEILFVNVHPDYLRSPFYFWRQRFQAKYRANIGHREANISQKHGDRANSCWAESAR